MLPINIALIGDYSGVVTAHRAIPQALDIAASNTACEVNAQWIATNDLSENNDAVLRQYQGIWCVPASPYNNPAGAISAIRYARENGTPFLGTCGGYQHALLEFARNVLGHDRANNSEEDPGTAFPLIAPLVCAMVEQEGDIHLRDGSRLAAFYARAHIREKYNCSYGLNRDYTDLFDGSALHFSAHTSEGDPCAIEIPQHRFFIGIACQPERSVLTGQTHPLIDAFVSASMQRAA